MAYQCPYTNLYIHDIAADPQAISGTYKSQGVFRDAETLLRS